MMFASYDELSKLRYGRILWRSTTMRRRLVRHWTDSRHPSRERFREARAMIGEVLSSTLADGALDRRLRSRGLSLRAIMREIPPVYGSFWRDSE